MNPATIRRWSRRLLVAIVLILGLVGIAIVLANVGVFDKLGEVLDTALEAMEKFSRMF